MRPLLLVFLGLTVMDPLQERDELVGRWKVDSVESAGQRIDGRDMTFQFTPGKLVWEPNSGQDEITYKTRINSGRKEIDVTFVHSPGTVVDGRTLLGIYTIDRDTLKICWSNKEGHRPSRFSGKREPTLFILKRLPR